VRSCDVSEMSHASENRNDVGDEYTVRAMESLDACRIDSPTQSMTSLQRLVIAMATTYPVTMHSQRSDERMVAGVDVVPGDRCPILLLLLLQLRRHLIN